MRGRPSTCSRVGKTTASERERLLRAIRERSPWRKTTRPWHFTRSPSGAFEIENSPTVVSSASTSLPPSLAKRELRTRVLQRRKGIDCGRRSHQAEQYRRRESTSCLLEENSARSVAPSAPATRADVRTVSPPHEIRFAAIACDLGPRVVDVVRIKASGLRFSVRCATIQDDSGSQPAGIRDDKPEAACPATPLSIPRHERPVIRRRLERTACCSTSSEAKNGARRYAPCVSPLWSDRDPAAGASANACAFSLTSQRTLLPPCGRIAQPSVVRLCDTIHCT